MDTFNARHSCIYYTSACYLARYLTPTPSYLPGEVARHWLPQHQNKLLPPQLSSRVRQPQPHRHLCAPDVGGGGVEGVCAGGAAREHGGVGPEALAPEVVAAEEVLFFAA